MNCEDYERPFPCDSNEFNACVLTMHEVIEDSNWDSMLDTFLGTRQRDAGFPVVLSELTIPNECNAYLLRVRFDPTDYTNDHFDIDFIAWDQSNDPKPADGLTYWSIFVLNGIAAPGREAVRFELFKLTESSSGLIAAGMIAYDINDVPVFRGDLTSQIPLDPTTHMAQLP